MTLTEAEANPFIDYTLHIGTQAAYIFIPTVLEAPTPMAIPYKKYLLPSALILFTNTPMSYAADARSAALGGSAIANGKGAYGTLENPSTLMRLKRNGQSFHFHLGASADVRDESGVIEELADEDDLIDQIDSEIDRLTNSPLNCSLDQLGLDVECLSNTMELGSLSDRLLNIFSGLDSRPLDANITFNLGLAVSRTRVPFAVHFRSSATIFAQSDISNNDIEYIEVISNALIDNSLTLGEIVNNAPFDIDDSGTLVIQEPDDVLDSTAQGSALIRQQLGISFAGSFNLGGLDWDIGITPKFSDLSAGAFVSDIDENFDSDSDGPSLSDRLEDGQVDETTTTVDIGLTTDLTILPVRFSVVGRNLITESVTTEGGFKFETTPQIIVGGAFDIGLFTISGDLALNEAQVDNLDTQVVSLGAEFGGRFFALRAGIAHDNARIEEASSLSLGASLGPLHIGGRITDATQAQLGAQLAFSF